MSRGLATLSINLEARLAELQEGFDKAARVADKNAAVIEARYNKLASAAVAVGTAFAGAFAADRMVQFFRSTLDGLDALNDLADATGASIENISALEDAAARTGTSLDTVSAALVKFNAELAGANAGSQTADILKRIGLSAEELRRVDPAEALLRVAVGLAQFAEDGDKARAVQELFGKSVREVAPLLKDLAEAGKLNATVTAEQAAAADAFNKQLAAFNKNMVDLARDGVGPLLEGFNQLFDAVEGRGVGGFRDLGDAIRVPIQALSVFAANVQFTLRGIGTELGGIAAQGAALARGDFAAFAGIGESMRTDAALARQEFDLLEQRLMSIGQVYQRADYSNEGRNYRRRFGALPQPPKPAAKSNDFVGPVLDPVTEAALKRLEATDTARIARLNDELARLIVIGGDTEAGKQGEALRAVREELAKLDPEQVKAAANRERLNKLLADTPAGRLTVALEDIALLNAELEKNPEIIEQWADAVRAVTARIPKDTGDALDELSDITKNFQRNVQDVLGDNIASALRGDFDSIEDAWKTMLLNMAAQAAAADIARRLFGEDGRGGWAAQLAGFFGFAKGGAFSQGQPITAFADGGVLTRPTFFGMGGGRMGVAGEAGYEGVLPLRRGPNGRLGVEAYGGGGVTVVNNVAAGMTRGEVVAAIQLGMDATKADLVSTLRAARVL